MSTSDCPLWCAPYRCTVVDDPELPAADGAHRSVMAVVPTGGAHWMRLPGIIHAWLTQRPGGQVQVHLDASRLGEISMPAATARRALAALAELLEQAEAGTGPATPAREQEVVVLSWPPAAPPADPMRVLGGEL